MFLLKRHIAWKRRSDTFSFLMRKYGRVTNPLIVYNPRYKRSLHCRFAWERLTYLLISLPKTSVRTTCPAQKNSKKASSFMRDAIIKVCEKTSLTLTNPEWSMISTKESGIKDYYNVLTAVDVKSIWSWTSTSPTLPATVHIYAKSCICALGI